MLLSHRWLIYDSFKVYLGVSHFPQPPYLPIHLPYVLYKRAKQNPLPSPPSTLHPPNTDNTFLTAPDNRRPLRLHL